MTLLDWLLLVFSPPGLLATYILFIQHERGGYWLPFKFFGIVGYLPDAFYNYTLCSLIFWQRPDPGKRTISVQLPIWARIPGIRGEIAIALANFLNWIAPSGAHVQLLHR